MPRSRTRLKLNLARVVKRIARKEMVAMRRIGARVRKVARRSIRVTKRKHSTAGNPPKTRRGRINLRDSILYHYSAREHSVIVGPRIYRTSKHRRVISRVPVPRLIEFGGTAIAGTQTAKGRPVKGILFTCNRRSGGRRRRGANGRFLRAEQPVQFLPTDTRLRYKARPYMRPAFQKTIRDRSLIREWSTLRTPF